VHGGVDEPFVYSAANWPSASYTYHVVVAPVTDGLHEFVPDGQSTFATRRPFPSY
jgi:hypothetical protein